MPERDLNSLLLRLISTSRFLIVLAVIGLFIASCVLLVVGGIKSFVVLFDIIFNTELTRRETKEITLDFIEIADQFLIGTVFYITALGLYTLFIDDRVPMPKWLRIQTIDDLKTRLIGVVIVVLGVSFLGEVITWEQSTGRELLGFGIAIASVVAALTFFLQHAKHEE